MNKTLDTVVKYFQENDTEELTSYDIKVKFNVPTNGLNLILQPALKKQWLAKRINKHGDFIYLAGSLIGAYGWTEEAPNPAPSEVIYPLPIEQIPPIKLSNIQIDNSIPLPGKTTSNLRTFRNYSGLSGLTNPLQNNVLENMESSKKPKKAENCVNFEHFHTKIDRKSLMYKT
jgi:hypothetical protein